MINIDRLIGNGKFTPLSQDRYEQLFKTPTKGSRKHFKENENKFVMNEFLQEVCFAFHKQHKLIMPRKVEPQKYFERKIKNEYSHIKNAKEALLFKEMAEFIAFEFFLNDEISCDDDRTEAANDLFEFYVNRIMNGKEPKFDSKDKIPLDLKMLVMTKSSNALFDFIKSKS